MSLYLCVFDGDEELEGVEVGSYDDFGVFRRFIADVLEGGAPASRFPILMNHADCEGTWSPQEAHALQEELLIIGEEMVSRDPIPLTGWQQELAASVGLKPRNLAECFLDVDGVPLIPRLLGLCAVAQRSGRPILFQ